MRNALLLSAIVTVAACTETKDKAGPVAAAPEAAAAKDAGAPKHVRLLVTGYETGELPVAGARMLEMWTKEEHWPEALVLSTGDMFSGNAVSSVFLGASSAEFARAMQYRAAALGNHDLDLGLETFAHFRKDADIVFLAANLKDKPGAEHPLKLAPYLVIDRSGVKVAVIGLTSEKTISTTVTGRSAGLEMVPMDVALTNALAGAKAEGAQINVVLIDDCFIAVKPIIDAHTEFNIDVVVGSHCDEVQQASGPKTSYITAGAKLADYISVEWEVPASTPPGWKIARKTVPEDGPAEKDLTVLSGKWKTKLDEELGQVIGYSKTGYPQDSKALRTWVATAIRDQAKADAGLINRKGLRAALPKGDITKASIYSMMPFENAVLTLNVTGAALKKLKANAEAALVAPASIDDAKNYTLATTEYLYFGGDNMGLQDLDPEPGTTGQMWQTPVIEWTVAQKTSQRAPLDSKLK